MNAIYNDKKVVLKCLNGNFGSNTSGMDFSAYSVSDGIIDGKQNKFIIQKIELVIDIVVITLLKETKVL